MGSPDGSLDTAALRDGGAVHRSCPRLRRLRARLGPGWRRRVPSSRRGGHAPVRSRGGRAGELAAALASMESVEGNRDGHIRLQWCHGAPGVVASLARVAPNDDEHERLLLAGGELTWRAGPLAKGANLCHGTAGNGYAFLALFERTGDELWLERARAFAMHAMAQVARARAQLGRGRYTLWTGDAGTALYLADCLAGGGN